MNALDPAPCCAAQEGHSDEELSLVIPPLARQLYDTLVNVRLHSSPEDVQGECLPVGWLPCVTCSVMAAGLGRQERTFWAAVGPSCVHILMQHS